MQKLLIEMSLKTTNIQRTCGLLLLLSGLFWQVGHAQVGYLEQVGGSEVELMMFLQSGDHERIVERDGSLINLENQNIQATYTVQRGSVVHVSFHQSFGNEADVLGAYDSVRKYLETLGVGLQAMRGQESYRLVTGEGNGLRSTLVITSDSGHYRLNAEIIAVR
ncbi:MAG: hypothetical protein AAGN35_04345 [Bacteroidota bacterium]